MYEDDEPVEQVQAAFNQGEKGKTGHVPAYLTIPGSFNDADLEELIRRFKETAAGRAQYLVPREVQHREVAPPWTRQQGPFVIDEYPLCTPEAEFTGGVWCADDACPCAAENSEIGNFREGEFTVAELREAIADHIIKRLERNDESADGVGDSGDAAPGDVNQ